MDYNKLLQRLAELDQPTNEACGEMSTPPLPSPAESTTPPSMSVNLNAQGMDNIESLLKLMTKVNPDMAKHSHTTSMIADPHPATMLTPPIDMDGEEDGELDGDKGEVAPALAAVGAGLGRAALSGAGALGRGAISSVANTIAPAAIGAALSSPSDSDSDIDTDSDLPHEDYANEPDEEYKDIDYITNKVAGGLNKPQGTYPKVAGGDNPMQKITRMEGTELRAAIRAELLQRLAEAKGAK
jgi:hypothetical protein